MMNNILSDLDDFLAPSQECIKMLPLPQSNKQVKPGGGGDEGAINSAAQVQIGNDFDDEIEFKVEINPKQQRPDLIKSKNNAETGE